jgi:hypothetical protein
LAAEWSDPKLATEPKHLEAADSEATATEEIERIIVRLDTGIAEERKAMDALLFRLRTTVIAA